MKKEYLKHLKHYVPLSFSLVFICLFLFCSTSLVNAYENERGLVAYYPFEEGEGNYTIDVSGNCNDGIIYGAKWTEGESEKGLEFDGINDCVIVHYSDSLNITEDITIEAWIKQNILMDQDYNIVVESLTNYGWFFGTNSGKAAWLIGNPIGGWNLVCIDGNLADGWSHIAGTYKASTGTANLYLDGNLVSSRSGTAQPTKHPGGFKIGLGTTSNYPFNGTIDEVKIYNRALTDAEIKEEYNRKSKYNSLKPEDSNCTLDSECKTNNCFKRVCKDILYCQNHSDCYSSDCHYCDLNDNKCKPLKDIGLPCLNDYECKIKICSEGICAEKRGVSKSEISKDRKISKNQNISQNEREGKIECNYDFDCLPTKYCDEDNKCKDLKDENFMCSRDAECKTGLCYYGSCKGEGYVMVWEFIIKTIMLLFTIFIFFVPGFAITFIKKEISLFERVCIGIGLSIALNILGIFILNKFGSPINFFIIVLYSFSFIWFGALFHYFKYYFNSENFMSIKRLKEKTNGAINTFKNNRRKALNLLILTSTLLFIFLVQYGIHSDYNYPFHTDEWQHLARAVQIMDTQTIPDVDPYYNKYPIGEMDLEIGFHVFLAEFYTISGQDPVLFYKFFPAIFTVLASLMLFLLVRKVTKNFYAGILSAIFFASLKSTIGILGIWFFVPLSMDFMLIFLFFYLYADGMRNNSIILLFFSVIIISSIALIHPQSASWIYPVIITYLLLFVLRNLLKISKFNILKFKNTIFGNILLFSLPFISFIYFFKILSKGSFETTLNWFLKDFIVFRGCPNERGLCEPNFVLNFYGGVAFVLAIVGVAYLVYKFVRNKGDDKFYPLILIAWIFVMAFLMSTLHIEVIGKIVASLIGIQYSPFTLLAGYIRIVYDAFLCLAALSGIGLYAIMKFMYFEIKNINLDQRKKGTVFISSVLIICILIFGSTYAGYYDLKVKIYKNIDDGDYKAIKWIEKNFGNGNVILARSHISETIYPISKNYVVSITPHANIPTTGERNSDVYSFFMGDCNTKRKILEEYDVHLVLEKYPIKCDFLEEIYNDGVYIYYVNI